MLVCLRLCEREEVLYLDAGHGSDVSSFHIVSRVLVVKPGVTPRKTMYFASQESGIEKDDIQTMFNVLDANNSGEALLWLPGSMMQALQYDPIVYGLEIQDQTRVSGS